MRIKVNDNEFDFTWEKSTTLDGWNELKTWWRETIDMEYEEDDEGELVSYPLVKIETNLPQLVIIGIEYGIGFQFGVVKSNGTFEALWYCAPSEREWMKFLDRLRTAEYQFSPAEYSFGTPRWSEEVA